MSFESCFAIVLMQKYALNFTYSLQNVLVMLARPCSSVLVWLHSAIVEAQSWHLRGAIRNSGNWGGPTPSLHMKDFDWNCMANRPMWTV